MVAATVLAVFLVPVFYKHMVKRYEERSMGDERRAPPSDADRDLECEVREHRPFSMAEALGRLAGPGGMKGASPISRLQQAQAQASESVRAHLPDPVGVLAGILIREVSNSPELLEHLDEPLAGVASHVRQLLASAEMLAELVRMTDMEWGRVMDERPFFESDGRAANPDDPYTLTSVETALNRFLAVLR